MFVSGTKAPSDIGSGCILLPADEIEPCINFFYRLSLGDGAARLVYRISEHCFGNSKIIYYHL